MNEQIPEPKEQSGLWKWTRRGLLALAVLITLIALAGLEETWRGKRAMDRFRAEHEANGDILTFEALNGSKIPDAQNFGTSAVWAPLFDYKIDPVTKSRVMKDPDVIQKPFLPIYKKNPAHGPKIGSWREGKKINLQEWQDYYRTPNADGTIEFPIASAPQAAADDVLLALSKSSTDLELLRQCASRPLCHYPVHYEDGFGALLPHLAIMKQISSYLCLRISAELAQNKSEQAFQDLCLLNRVVASLDQEPLVITYLVQNALISIEDQAVWDGLSSHQWSEEQIAKIQGELEKRNVLENYKTAMRGEIACQLFSLEILRQAGGFPNSGGGIEGYTQAHRIIKLFIPFTSGFFYQNELNLARIETEWIRIASFEKAADTNLVRGNLPNNPYNIFLRMLLPALDKCISKGASAQSEVDLAKTACALERYRLANGSYPDNLAALTPKFMASVPNDIVDGKPLRYRRTDNGQFVLYSVGWNQKDDGGVVGIKGTKTQLAEGRGALDLNSGDWVWTYGK